LQRDSRKRPRVERKRASTMEASKEVLYEDTNKEEVDHMGEVHPLPISIVVK
jgi:hypothetical protein